MGNKGNQCGMVVDARQVGPSILVEFTHTTVCTIYSKRSEKEKISSEQKFFSAKIPC